MKKSEFRFKLIYEVSNTINKNNGLSRLSFCLTLVDKRGKIPNITKEFDLNPFVDDKSLAWFDSCVESAIELAGKDNIFIEYDEHGMPREG